MRYCTVLWLLLSYSLFPSLTLAQLHTSNIAGKPAGLATGPRCVQLNEAGRQFSCSDKMYWDETTQTLVVDGDIQADNLIGSGGGGSETVQFDDVVGGTPNRCVRFDASGILTMATEDCLSGSPKHNAATTDPTVNDDSTQGYSRLSRWLNTTSGTLWTLLDATDGAADWQQPITQATWADTVQQNPLVVAEYEPEAPTIADTTGLYKGTLFVSPTEGFTIKTTCDGGPCPIVVTPDATQYFEVRPGNQPAERWSMSAGKPVHTYPTPVYMLRCLSAAELRGDGTHCTQNATESAINDTYYTGFACADAGGDAARLSTRNPITMPSAWNHGPIYPFLKVLDPDGASAVFGGDLYCRYRGSGEADSNNWSATARNVDVTMATANANTAGTPGALTCHGSSTTPPYQLSFQWRQVSARFTASATNALANTLCFYWGTTSQQHSIP